MVHALCSCIVHILQILHRIAIDKKKIIWKFALAFMVEQRSSIIFDVNIYLYQFILFGRKHNHKCKYLVVTSHKSLLNHSTTIKRLAAEHSEIDMCGFMSIRISDGSMRRNIFSLHKLYICRSRFATIHNIYRGEHVCGLIIVNCACIFSVYCL